MVDLPLPAPASPPRARLFVTLVPRGSLADAIARVRDGLRATCPGARPVATDRLHLTLAFLGTAQWDSAATTRVASALAGNAAEAFDLVLDRVASFRVGPRHVGWIGPGITPPALAVLADGVRARLAASGLDVDGRPFVPHVTVLRGLAERLPPSPIAPIVWPVDRFVLIRSVLDHPRYDELASWNLSVGGSPVAAADASAS